MSATITFKAKVETVRHTDNSVAYQRVKVPVLTRSHCDMAGFRASRRYGFMANSDLFPNALARIAREVTNRNNGHLRLDALPGNVTVDTTGFLARVTITLED
jgi:hypothetical protein